MNIEQSKKDIFLSVTHTLDFLSTQQSQTPSSNFISELGEIAN